MPCSPRGNSNLECSRAYAAMTRGCTPLGKGGQEEVEECFGRLRPRCPLLDLYRNSTGELLELAVALTAQRAERQRLSTWGRQSMSECRGHLRELAR